MKTRPAQRYGVNAGEAVIQAQRCLALWSAVLEQAFNEARGQVGKGNFSSYVRAEEVPGIQARARRWFESTDTGAGSFLWLCALFDLHPELVRAELTVERKRPPSTGRERNARFRDHEIDTYAHTVEARTVLRLPGRMRSAE